MKGSRHDPGYISPVGENCNCIRRVEERSDKMRKGGTRTERGKREENKRRQRWKRKRIKEEMREKWERRGRMRIKEEERRGSMEKRGGEEESR